MNLVALSIGFLRHGGRVRALITCMCTAVVSGLILVAAAVAQFREAVTERGHEDVANLIRDGGVRPGYVFALVLICLIPLTLLQQVVRLGTASRERRLAALRLAGATPLQVRAMAAIETGVPALVGGLLGAPVYLLFRGFFGGTGPDPWSHDPTVVRELRLVPMSVTPAWWQMLLVAVGVGLLGALAGALASRALAVSPLSLSRGGAHPPPRPWLPLGMAITAIILLSIYAVFYDKWYGTAGAFAGIGCAIGGVLLIAPWVAYRMGRMVAERASSPAVLLAARRLVMDARPAGRAASTTGAIALVTGGAATFVADLVTSSAGEEAIYVVPTVLVLVVLLAALLVTVFSLAVHGVESLTDRKRSLASLAAEGTPLAVLERAHLWEAALVALPVSTVAVVATTLGTAPFIAPGLVALLTRLVLVVTILALTWLALLASTRLVRPWLVRATAAENLRTA